MHGASRDDGRTGVSVTIAKVILKTDSNHLQKGS